MNLNRRHWQQTELSLTCDTDVAQALTQEVLNICAETARALDSAACYVKQTPLLMKPNVCIYYIYIYLLIYVLYKYIVRESDV